MRVWCQSARRQHDFISQTDGVGLSPMYRVSEGVRSTHSQDGAIVLDIRQGQMFNLNVVGSRILKLLESGLAEAEIVEEIVREFGVSRHLAENDVQDFFQTLTKYQLVDSTDRGG
jgi:hypothetical protein